MQGKEREYQRSNIPTPEYIQDTMSDNALPSFWIVMGYTFAIVVSISMFAYLFVFIPSACAGVMQTSGGKITCGIEPGAYLFGAAFVVILAYSTIKLLKMLFPEILESCPICSLISKR
jgi:hypothetical protein